MRVRWCLIVAVFIILGLISPALLAVEKELEIEGMIKIDYPPVLEAKVEVNLGGDLLSLAIKVIEEKNREASQFLADLKTIKVRIYDKACLGEHKLEDVMKFYEGQMQEGKWEIAARVKDKEARIGVYSLSRGGVVAGLTVLIGKPEEIIVVNLAGKVDMNKLSRLSKMPGIGEIASITAKVGNPQPDFVIKGVVKDAETGKPIAGAKVSDHGYGPEPRKGATTDSEGKYSYATWYEEHNIVAQAPGYKPQRQTLMTKFLGNEKEKVMDFALERE